MPKIPEKVASEIEERIRKELSSNEEFCSECIECEKECYIEFNRIDYSCISLEQKNKILNNADEYEDWCEKLNYVNNEINAIKEIGCILEKYEKLDEIDRIIKDSSIMYDGKFVDQINYIKEEIHKVNVRKEIDPVKNILIDMENIIGDSCYNGNIQNYGAYGVYEGEGREFRYPVTFLVDGKKDKHWLVPSNINSEDLMTGYYAFGANRLRIYRALYHVLKYLEKNYGLVLPEK